MLHTYKEPIQDAYRGGDVGPINTICISIDNKTLNALHTYKEPMQDAYRDGDREAYRGGDGDAYRGGNGDAYRGGDGGPINTICISTDNKTLNALHTYKEPMQRRRQRSL